MKFIKISVLLSVIFICFQHTAKAQTTIKNSVIGNGSQTIIGSNNSIKSTLGQPLIGRINNSNNTSYIGFWYLINATGITDVDELSVGTLPTEFSLSQNYPNPFNPTTIIKYSIPNNSVMLSHSNREHHPKNVTSNQAMPASVQVRDNNANVQLKVYDILGKEVATLVDKKQSAGNYEVTFNAEYLSSGIYFFQLNSVDFFLVRKMILLR